MWVWHACLSSPAAPCDPRTWAQAAEYFAALVLAFGAVLAFFLFLVTRP